MDFVCNAIICNLCRAPAERHPCALAALTILRRGQANQDNAAAQAHLAVCYTKGEGVPLDLGVAVQWYTKSANGGLPSAQYGLAVCLDKGRGIAVDKDQARFPWAHNDDAIVMPRRS